MNPQNKTRDNDNSELNMGGIGNPFVRKSVIARSPPTAVTKTVPVSDTVKNSDEGQSNSVKRLGAKIANLLDFLKTRSNVHKDIVTMSREIQALYMQVSDELGSGSVSSDRKPQTSRQTQTEEPARPNLVMGGTPKRRRDGNDLSPKGNRSKRKRGTTPNRAAREGEHTVPRDTGINTAGKPDPNVKEPDWVKVVPKARKRKKTIRPDALVIGTCGNASYADILRQVKKDPRLDNLGRNVRNIRKTGKGELMFELSKPAHQNTSEFRSAVEEVLGDVAKVRALSHEVRIEIRDIDEVTSKEDVYEALIKESSDFKSLQPSAVRSLRRAYGGTQTATISVSAALACRLIEMAKIRIGWVVCRIRENVAPRRCYKCLDYGHRAADCKGQDLSANCLRCGKTGHKIGTCSNKPSCLLCKNGTDTASDHVTGCAACPYYKRALRRLRT